MRQSSACLLLVAAAVGTVNALHAPSMTVSRASAKASIAMQPGSMGLKKVPTLAHENDAGAMYLRGGNAGTGKLVFSLFKAIIGSGVLCLSGGMAAFTNNVSMIPAAGAVAAFSAIVSAYCYYQVGVVCAATNSVSLKQAWEKTVGASTSWVPSLVIISQTAVACICYAIIIGDVLRDLSTAAKLEGVLRDRNTLLPLAGVFVLLPLCLLRDFGMLAYTSMFGVAGIIYTMLFMTYRYIAGNYAKGGDLVDSLRSDQKPQFGNKFVPIKVLILVSMFNTAYLAHYDAPKFLGQVGRNLGEFRKLVEKGFIAAFAACIIIMSAGFLTFGGNSLGLILNNYASKDSLALFARGGMLASIVFSFPLVFSGFRSGLLAFLDIHNPSQMLLDSMAVVGVATAVGIGMVLTNLGFLASFAGALFGTSLIYIFPTIMYMKLQKNLVAADAALPKVRGWMQSGPVSKGIKLGNEYYINLAIAVLGCVLAAIGASVSYMQSFTNILD